MRSGYFKQLLKKALCLSRGSDEHWKLQNTLVCTLHLPSTYTWWSYVSLLCRPKKWVSLIKNKKTFYMLKTNITITILNQLKIWKNITYAGNTCTCSIPDILDQQSLQEASAHFGGHKRLGQTKKKKIEIAPFCDEAQASGGKEHVHIWCCF